MAILVTGGAGFIGSHFIEQLLATRRDARIVCLDDFNDYYSPDIKRANVAGFAHDKRVTIVQESFCDRALVRQVMNEHRVHHVVHLGAYAGVRASLSRPLDYEQANVQGTLVLLEAARELRVERFVLVSSSTVYGPQAGVPFVEDAPLGIPLSPYGVTKRSAELWALQYHAVHKLPVVCLRPFSVYGPRIRPDLALYVFATAIATNQRVPVFGDGTARRDFTHVSDVCRGILVALESDKAVGNCINLGHHDPIAVNEVLAMLEAELGQPAMVEHHPSFVQDLPVTCADLTKARRLLGYHPQVQAADGIADFVRWFRESTRRGK